MVIAVLFGIIALGMLITTLYAFMVGEPVVGALTGVISVACVLLSIAAANTEGPGCNKVYEPDGSYVETCEYPADE